MTLLDLLLLTVLAISAAGGYRMGLIVRAASLIGFLGGIALAVLTVPYALDLVAPASLLGRAGTVLVAMLVTVAATSAIAQGLANGVRRAVHDSPLKVIDRIGGAAAGIATTLVIIWFAAPLAGMIPGLLAQQVRGSAIVTAVQTLGPDAPNPLAGLQTFLADTRFPEVFSNLAPAPATQPPPEAIPVSQDLVQRISNSTVKIEASGCGSAFAGSGWAAAQDTIITNAHVVAGANAVQVLRPDGSRLDAIVVVFDDNRDLAVLQVDGLGQEPLLLGTADDGEGAATFGHPAGQEQLRVAPARVERTITATGRDIYGQDRTEREVVIIGAELAQGDSGSAVVDADGTVVGTIFAISPDARGTAYALANSEVEAALTAPRNPGATGRCS
jgi:S1-C subfamily serine protease